VKYLSLHSEKEACIRE